MQWKPGEHPTGALPYRPCFYITFFRHVPTQQGRLSLSFRVMCEIIQMFVKRSNTIEEFTYLRIWHSLTVDAWNIVELECAYKIQEGTVGSLELQCSCTTSHSSKWVTLPPILSLRIPGENIWTL
jgi:hypothetical protein